MIYVPNDYSNYKYLVTYSDNYVVLTNVHSVTADWSNPRTINTIIQYFTPSISTIESSTTISTQRTFEQVEITDDFWSRADCNQVVYTQFLYILTFVFLVNAMSRLFKKGGMFFGS